MPKNKDDQIIDELLGGKPQSVVVRKPELAKKPTFGERLKTGMLDTTRGLKQDYLLATNPVEAANYTQQTNAEIDDYEARRGEGAGFDVVRLGGNVLSTLPLAAFGGSLPKAMIGGGLAALTQYNQGGTPTDKAIQGAAGVLGGGVGYGVAKAGVKGASYIPRIYHKAMSHLAPRVQILDDIHLAGIDITKLAPAVKDALVKDARKQISVTGKIDANALARKNKLEALGFKPTSGQVTRDPAQWQFEQNWSAVSGVGDDLRYQLADQSQQLGRNLDDIAGGINGNRLTPYEVGDKTQTAIRNIDDELSTKVSDTYKAIESASGSKGAVTVDNLVKMVGDLKRYTYAKPYADDVLNYLKSVGLVDDAGNVAMNKNSQPALSAMQAEELRKFINRFPAMANGTNMAGVKSSMVKALDDDIFYGLNGDDVYAPARALHAQRKNLMAADPLKKMTTPDGIHPDNIYKNNILSGNVNDLKSIQNVLLQSPEGKTVWESIRQTVIQDIKDAAFSGDPSRKSMTPAGFKRIVDRIGPEKMKILFPDEAARVADNLNAAQDLVTAPPMTKMSSSNSATPMLDAFMRLGDVPLLGNNPLTLGLLGMVGKGREEAQRAAIMGQLGVAATGNPVSDAARRAAQAQFEKKIIPYASGLLAPAGGIAGSRLLY